MTGRSRVVITLAPKSPTIEDLRQYRRTHGCSLHEACKALGYVGTRIEVVPW